MTLFELFGGFNAGQEVHILTKSLNFKHLMKYDPSNQSSDPPIKIWQPPDQEREVGEPEATRPPAGLHLKRLHVCLNKKKDCQTKSAKVSSSDFPPSLIHVSSKDCGKVAEYLFHACVDAVQVF